MRAFVRVIWAWLLLLHLAEATHIVYENLLEVEAAAVPPSIVDPELRTGVGRGYEQAMHVGNLLLLTAQPLAE
nr:unnamed protein product [Digitaria exilis]